MVAPRREGPFPLDIEVFGSYEFSGNRSPGDVTRADGAGPGLSLLDRAGFVCNTRGELTKDGRPIFYLDLEHSGRLNERQKRFSDLLLGILDQVRRTQ